MFRLQNNTPEVYVNESRDFQLFCRLYDCINNGVMFDIDLITRLYDPFQVNERMLNLLCTKVGFYPKNNLNNDALRYIISSFPYLTKYKGTKRGIEIAVSTILKINKSNSDFNVMIQTTNKSTISVDNKDKVVYTPIYDIQITFSDNVFDLSTLDELLKYVLPIGYTYHIYVKTASVNRTSNFTSDTVLKLYTDASIEMSDIANKEDANIGQDEGWYDEATFTNGADYQNPTVNKMGNYIEGLQIGLYDSTLNASTISGEEDILAGLSDTIQNTARKIDKNSATEIITE